MQIRTKDATITNTDSDEAFPGTFEVVLSSPTEDRDGDTLLPDEWDLPLPDRINFDVDHGMTVGTVVGSGVPRIDDETGNLVVAGEYSSLDRAQELRTLVGEGHIDKTSVAFMSTKVGKGAKGVVKRELLNGSFVAIPSNREAVVLNSKGLSLKVGARNNTDDAAAIQDIHDAAAGLGADCAATKALVQPKRAGKKSIVGSLEATQDRVNQALNDAFPGAWPWLRGTLPDGNDGGTAVFDLWDDFSGDRGTFRQSYTDDGSTVTLTGDRVAVDVMEIITSPGDSTSTDAAATKSAAGKPAADDVAAASDEAAAEMAVKAAALRAKTAIATTN